MNASNKTPVTKLLGTIAIGGTLAASLMACSPAVISSSSSASSSTRAGNVQTYTFNAADGPDREATAEEMALVAEKLVRNNTVIQAHKLAFRALEHNQFNIRAQFVLKATQPMLELKGIYSRVEPIARQNSYDYKNYKKQIAEAKADVFRKDINAFLLDGPADLTTEGQVQDVIEKYVEKLDELRDWLKENRTVAHTINYYEELPGAAAACSAKEVTPTTWVLTNCDVGVKKFTAKMNIADFETIRQHTAGVQTYLAASTAYSLDGVFKSTSKLDSRSPISESIPVFTATKGIGHLRNTKFFAMLPKVTADYVVGMRMAKKLHAEICPKGQMHGNSRKGMLFSSGICAEQSTRMDQLLDVLDLMSHGRLATFDMQGEGQPVRTTADIRKFMSNIPADVREFGPVSYDKCGEVVAVGNGNMSGLFARGEFNQLLRNNSVASCNK